MKTQKKLFHVTAGLFATVTILALCSFTPQTTTDNSSAQFIEMTVKEMKAELPTDHGGGFVMTAIYIANSNLVTEFTCAASVVDLMRIGFSEKSKEEYMRECFSDAEAKLMARICAEANYGIRYVYLTSSRSNQTEIFFTPSDLKAFLSSTSAN